MAGLPEQFEVQGEERLYQVLKGLEEVGVEETFEDENGAEMEVDEWYKSVQLRLGRLPDSTDKYRPTCTAIETLQDLIQEVLEKLHTYYVTAQQQQSSLTFDPSDLTSQLAAKQEQLFQALVHFHIIELATYENALEEAERMREEEGGRAAGVGSNYVEQQKRMMNLKNTKEELVQAVEGLKVILDAPRPIMVSMATLEQQTMSASPLSPTETTGVFPRFKEICDRAQILLIRCQVMASDVDERIKELQAVVLQHRDKFIRDLVEVEGWLAQVYNLLCQEPARGLGDYAGNEQQSASSEEGEGEEEPDSGGEGVNGAISPPAPKSDAQQASLLDEVEEPPMEQEWEEEEEYEEEEELDFEREREQAIAYQWVKQLHLVPMRHSCEYSPMTVPAPTGDDVDLPLHSPTDNIDGIIAHLQSCLKQLSTRSHKVKSTVANINFVIVALSTEMATQLRARLVKVNQMWEPIGDRLRHRIAQLTFEKAQKQTLESVQEAVEELESQLTNNMMPKEVDDAFNELMDVVVSIEQFESTRDGFLSQLETSMEALLLVPSEDRQLLQDTVHQLKEAYNFVTEKIQAQKAFLESCKEEWAEYHSQLYVYEAKLVPAEELSSRETFGYGLQEVTKYNTDMKTLRGTLPAIEAVLTELFQTGNDLLSSVGEGSDAESFVDESLSTCKRRWFELLETLDEREVSVQKVIINWRAYSQCYDGTRTFITGMTKMVGTEPLESSDGNITLLPMYRTYASQIRTMQVQFEKLQSLGNELADDKNVGGRDTIRRELLNLRMLWEPLKDNVFDSLQILQHEEDDWYSQDLN